jgi:tetratricopeptide (TPR) repeat protein
MEPFKQVYGSRTGWTFPPLAAENQHRNIPHDAENRGELTVVRQEGASRWVVEEKNMNIQLKIAHRLARAHGHFWAIYNSEQEIETAEQAVAQAVRREAEQGSSYAWGGEVPRVFEGRPGEERPAVVDWVQAGDIWHVTASNRLAWTVDAEGGVIFVLRRPEGEALTAWWAPDHHYHGKNRVERWSPSGVTVDVGRRHLAALAEALEAAEQMLTEGAVVDAAETFAAILGEEPENPQAYGGLARTHIAAGNLDQAEAFIAAAPAKFASRDEFDKQKMEIEKAKGALGLAYWIMGGGALALVAFLKFVAKLF